MHIYHPINKSSTYEKNVNPRKDINITKLGVKIPMNAPNYHKFVAMMKTSETELIKSFPMSSV